MAFVYIGLGSNLSDPIAQVKTAMTALKKLRQSKFVCASSLYRSAPMIPGGRPGAPEKPPAKSMEQPDYINAVVCIDSLLQPDELLDALQQIESSQGRVRSEERWGPRTLDLDILLIADQIITSPRLEVPHKGLHERSFVLYPLQEIAPDLVVPGRGHIAELTAKCHKAGLEPVNLS